MDFLKYFEEVNTGFRHNEEKNVEFLTVPSFDDAGGLIHCFTTRKTGVSKGGFSSLNFSFGREKNKQNILKNFSIIAETLNVPVEDIVLDNYGHTPNVIEVTEEERGKGVYNNESLPTCDGLATKIEKLPLVTMHADCAPIFLYDKEKKAVCVCHAGWRGVVGGIVKNALDIMTKNFGCEAENILAGVGPCIRSCCFEIQEDVERIFKTEFGDFSVERRDGRIFGDIEIGIALSFYKYGLPAKNLTIAKECTYCDEENYFSYRRQGKSGGAMASVVMIK